MTSFSWNISFFEFLRGNTCYRRFKSAVFAAPALCAVCLWPDGQLPVVQLYPSLRKGFDGAFRNITCAEDKSRVDWVFVFAYIRSATALKHPTLAHELVLWVWYRVWVS